MNLVDDLREIAHKASNYLNSYKGYPVVFADPLDDDFHELALDLPDTLVPGDFGAEDLAIYGITYDKGVILLTYNKESTNLGTMDIAYLNDWDTIYLTQYLYDNHENNL